MSAVRRWLPHGVALVGLAVLIWGRVLDALGRFVYVPQPPFVWRWSPQVDGLAVVAVLVAVAAVWAIPRLLRMPVAAFVVGVTALTAALRLALPAARGGTGSWDAVFDPARSFEAANEYLPALPALRYGVHIFLDRFAEVVPSLPVHSAGHPPGLLVAMHALHITTPAGLAALCIGAVIVAVPVTYWLGRRLLDEPEARIAALLLALSPGVTMFGVSSADGIALLLGTVAALALVSARAWVRWMLGSIVLAIGSFFAWSLLAIGAWATVVELRRRGFARAIGLAAACGVALLVGYTVLWMVSGFDPIGTIRATEQVYRAGIAQGRPYSFWLLGSPTAFLVTVGLPITWYALRGLAAGRTVALAIFAVIVVASVLGFTKAETERIWLFFAPGLCLAAATMVPRERMPWIAGALLTQALACELLFDSVW